MVFSPFHHTKNLLGRKLSLLCPNTPPPPQNAIIAKERYAPIAGAPQECIPAAIALQSIFMMSIMKSKEAVNSVDAPSIGVTAFRSHYNSNDSIFSVKTYRPMERSHRDLSNASIGMFVTFFLK